MRADLIDLMARNSDGGLSRQKEETLMTEAGIQSEDQAGALGSQSHRLLKTVERGSRFGRIWRASVFSTK